MSWLQNVLEAARSRRRVEGRRERGSHSLSASIARARRLGVNAIIAELKMASPSGFRSAVNPREYIKYVERAGASGLSVITEPLEFKGSYGLLSEASKIADIPILMKDFVVTEGQVHDAHVLGADAVLLIVSIIGDEERLRGLYGAVTSLGMEPLVEVHSETDLNLALKLKPAIIGVNARNLNTLQMNYEQQERILASIPEGVLRIAESGIDSPERIRRLRLLGADGFLIGTSLMKNMEMINNFLYA